MKVSEGFQPADCRNLPKLNYIMLLEYMQENECYNVAETRGAKALLASREAYVDTAVGYVEVKRDGDDCLIKCRITPEHKIKGKLYMVNAIINETEEKIIQLNCNDCASSAGGCKHSICFAMWLIKRSDEPPATSVTCYWNRPRLSSSVTKGKVIMAKEIGVRIRNNDSITMDLDLNTFIEECRKRKMSNGMILKYNGIHQESLINYTVFNLMVNFIKTNQDHSFENFLSFTKSCVTTDIIENIAKQTKEQSNSKLWHSLRQGRITGSKIYEAIHCKTENGSLVQSILGGYKVPQTKAIKRGKILENAVLKEIEKEYGTEAERTGLILISPLIGASPDGLFEDCVVEIKCPVSTKTMQNYVKSDCIQEKFKAQIMLQMHAAKKSSGLFCIADPNFENNKMVHKYYVKYDITYVENLLQGAEEFWNKYIFDIILNSAK